MDTSISPPVIGILTVSKGERLLGNRANFIDLIRTGQRRGVLVCVVTPEAMDWEQSTVRAWRYDLRAKRWYRQVIPLPTVVYNRVPNRDYEASSTVVATIERLQQSPHHHLFNPHFFNKWEITKILQQTDIATYLPKTELIANNETLERMCREHRAIYLKPVAGKAGNGIYRLTHVHGRYVLESSFGGKKTRQRSDSVADVWQFVQPLLQQTPYIAQQAISLLTYEQRPFDVRVLVQKDGHGQWGVSGVGIRVAGKGGITTHVPQGGAILDRRRALVPYFGERRSRHILDSIRTLATNIAMRLDDHYRTLGEMSMDIGVTKEGELWFFEANAKPMKFDEPSIRKVQLQRIIEYGQYAATTL